jgi:hypothetical protein
MPTSSLTFASEKLMESFDQVDRQLELAEHSQGLHDDFDSSRQAEDAAVQVIENARATLKDLRQMIGITLDGSIEDETEAEHAAFSIVNAVQAGVAEVESIPGQVEAETGIHPAGLVDWLKKHLSSALRRLGAWLWHVVSTMLTPKGWKLTGKFGANAGPFGLAEAGFEIDFGL